MVFPRGAIPSPIAFGLAVGVIALVGLLLGALSVAAGIVLAVLAIASLAYGLLRSRAS